MPKLKFSAMAIKNLKPKDKSTEYFEIGRSPGEGAFGVRVSPKGKKTWFVMYQNHAGKVKRFSIGSFPGLSLKAARKAAGDAMTEVNNGNDPMEAKQAKRTAPTMTALWDEYQKALARRTKKKAASTIQEEQRRWSKVIKPKLGAMRVEDIKRKHISSLLNKVADSAPVSANRLHSLLSVMFKTALNIGWIEVHPMYMMDKPGGQEVARKRYLTDAEIKTLWRHLDQLKPNPRDILKLGLLSAQRPGEIMSMRWEELDLKAGTWTLHNTKNESTHIVPLSRQVFDILLAREKVSEWVFPSSYNRAKGARNGHATSTKNARKKVQEQSGITGWTAHDLRRTARTIMSRLQIKQHIRERVLNHSQSGIEAVYDQYDYLQEKAAALDKLGREIDLIIGADVPTAMVIPLKAQG